jgi:hypothetical protein
MLPGCCRAVRVGTVRLLSNTAYVVVREGSHVSCMKVTHITPRTSPEFPVHSWRGSNRSPHPRITSPPRGQDIQESAGKRRVRCGARRQGGLVICCASVDLTRYAQRSRVLGVTARRHSAGRQTKQRAGLCGWWRSASAGADDAWFSFPMAEKSVTTLRSLDKRCYVRHTVVYLIRYAML